jgi:hypothetical protein
MRKPVLVLAFIISVFGATTFAFAGSTFEAQIGGEYMDHYNFSSQLPSNETPPKTLFAYAEFTLWFTKSMGGYFLLQRNLGGTSSSFVGAGGKLTLLDFPTGVRVALAGDLVYYSAATPDPPRDYSTGAIAPRLGFILDVPIGVASYLEGGFMIGRLSSNWMAFPSLGIGLRF